MKRTLRTVSADSPRNNRTETPLFREGVRVRSPSKWGVAERRQHERSVAG